jgi:formylglycine-generating enzyme required for sulfatase activity
VREREMRRKRVTMQVFSRLAFAAFFLLWLCSVAYAEKYCPVDGETYPDSARYCGTHGNKLDTKKPASSKSAPPKTAVASGAAKIYVYYDGGQKEVFDFSGFNTDCDGYGREGITYSEKGVSVLIPWRDVSFVFPEYGRAQLKNGQTVENSNLNRVSCPGARIKEIRKRKVLIVGYEGEKEEAVEMALSRMEVFSFEGKGLEDGRAVREVIVQKRGEQERLAEEEKQRQAAEAKRVAEEEAKKRAEAEASKKFHERVAGEFVFVKGGCYQMGDAFGSRRLDEMPVHEVCVDDFYLGKYEVTQGQWKALMENNPSDHKGDDNYPVERVSWNDVQDFVRKLNDKTGQSYRLPTEAEWEYAARSGGKPEKYSGGGDVDAVAWYQSTSGGKTHHVGTKAPNGLGIHDMSGNVWEWVQDWYDGGYYSGSPRDNPKGPSSGTHRVGRGGSWYNDATFCRSTNRYRYAPEIRDDFLGFRLVRTP